MEDALVLVIAISCGAFVVVLSAAIVRVLKLDKPRRPLWQDEADAIAQERRREFEARMRGSEWRTGPTSISGLVDRARRVK